LRDVVQELAGSDWLVEDDDFDSLCAKAGIDFEELMRVPGPLEPSQLEDVVRKEIGDLGELLAVLILIGHESRDPALVFPKNTLKLYERVSEPGVDVIALSLDMSLASDAELTADEHLTLVESKGSGSSSFVQLASAAAGSLNDIDAARLQRELRLIRSSLRIRGATDQAKRVKKFLIGFAEHSSSVGMCAVLLSPMPLREPVAYDGLGRLANSRPVHGHHIFAPVHDVRRRVFGFRHNDE
jgi:hypothetical protein